MQFIHGTEEYAENPKKYSIWMMFLTKVREEVNYHIYMGSMKWKVVK